MNTLFSQTAYGKGASRAIAAGQKEAQRLEKLFSRFIPSSDIAALNESAGDRAVKLKPETYKVLALAQQFARDTEGCFDVTVGPLVRLWSTGMSDAAALSTARSLSGYSSLSLAYRGRMASLTQKGQSVDLGGIGKGYAAGRMLAVFRRHRIRSAFVALGGNIAVLGKKPDGSPWRVAIRDPGNAQSIIGTLSVSNASVVTSGDDQRAVSGVDGTLHSHIIDPHTGTPVQGDLLSVTVISASSALADALATALFAARMKEGMRFLKRYPGTQAVFVDRERSVFLTKDLSGSFRAAEGIKTYLV
ncbi:MAG TPA: FAD:protein FMN transferase [Candidatus Limiplasma sp.]|nr:FAD:protein FMN transferase [Candidatus Limiplasma sp.]HRX07901.1 FAD:protein FMN transferase [Candidatus Limiplasma sp.]